MNTALVSSIARIILRYGIAAAVTYGSISKDFGDAVSNDPNVAVVVEIVIGAIAGGLVELWDTIDWRKIRAKLEN